MHTIETSIILSIILIAISTFLVFTMNFENKINKNITNKVITAKNEYSIDNERKFKPDKIQRIITNIENIIGGNESEQTIE